MRILKYPFVVLKKKRKVLIFLQNLFLNQKPQTEEVLQHPVIFSFYKKPISLFEI